jgi:hypothetical protein
MVMFTPNSARQSLIFEREFQRLRSLLSDMEQIGKGVPVADLAGDGAPVLDSWRLAQRTTVCIEGLCSGHPKLPGINRPILTSDLWLLSGDRQWARTLSRWYSLGEPRPFDRLQSRGDLQ